MRFHQWCCERHTCALYASGWTNDTLEIQLQMLCNRLITELIPHHVKLSGLIASWLQMAATHAQEEASNAAPAATAGDAAERWGGAFPAFRVRQQGQSAVPQPLRPAMLAAVERGTISVDSDETDLSDDDRDRDDGHQQSADCTPGAAAASVCPPQAAAETAAAAAEEAGEVRGVEQQDVAQGKPTGRKTLAETVKQIQEERQPSSGQLQGFPSSNSDADVSSGCVQGSGAEGASKPEERR